MSLSLSNLQRSKINSLRSLGKAYLSSHSNEEAIQCYSAILQIVEGLDGEESFELRRRCGLTLAECELRAGRPPRAVARCSEVIEESTNYDESQNYSLNKVDLLKTLGRAHYRRGVSLKKLDLLRLALVDMKLANKYQPDDQRTLKEIAALKAKLGTAASAAVDERDPQLADYTEACQVRHPREPMTERQINKLIAPRPLVRAPDIDGLQGMLGEGMGGGLGELLGGGQGSMNLIKFALQQLLGWSSETASEAMEVLQAAQGAWQKVKWLKGKVTVHREAIMLAATLLWAIVAFRS